MERVDVCVRGSGAVALCAALALARQQLQVALTAPRPSTGAPDVRAYALNASSRMLLSELKVWSALPADAVTPVHEMRVAGDAASGALEFSSWQQSVDALAWIVDAAELESVLRDAVKFAPHLQLIEQPPESATGRSRVDSPPRAADDATRRPGGAVEAALTVWADGKATAAGAGRGVHIDRHAYGQTALAARLACEQAHAHTAWQWFRAPDVLALLPFDRPAADHGYALVWSLPSERADELARLADADFEAHLNGVCAPAVGRLKLASARAAWPLSLARAEPLCGPGWVLIGDAAHVVHPLAGQGLNLGLADVVSLASTIAGREPWRSPGDEALLRRHVRARALPTRAMAGLTDGLLHLFSNDLPLVRELRNRGMGWINRIAPIKRFLTARALDA